MRATYVVAGVAALIAILFAATLAPLVVSGALPFSPHNTNAGYKPGAVLNRQLASPTVADTTTNFPGLIISEGSFARR